MGLALSEIERKFDEVQQRFDVRMVCRRTKDTFDGVECFLAAKEGYGRWRVDLSCPTGDRGSDFRREEWREGSSRVEVKEDVKVEQDFEGCRSRV